MYLQALTRNQNYFERMRSLYRAGSTSTLNECLARMEGWQLADYLLLHGVTAVECGHCNDDCYVESLCRTCGGSGSSREGRSCRVCAGQGSIQTECQMCEGFGAILLDWGKEYEAPLCLYYLKQRDKLYSFFK